VHVSVYWIYYRKRFMMLMIIRDILMLTSLATRRM
jgi:hypothetical protein